jgi:hypothetical protein
MLYHGMQGKNMQIFDTILLSFIAATTSLTCIFILLINKRNNEDKTRLLWESKLETIDRMAQDFSSSCTQVLEVVTDLKGKLGIIEKTGREAAHKANPDAGRSDDSGTAKQQLEEETQSVQSLVARLQHLYAECYLPASTQLIKQTEEAASLKDSALTRLFNELTLLQGRLQETWQLLNNMPPFEKARVLRGHFSRTSNYLYLLRETSQHIIDRTICLKR